MAPAKAPASTNPDGKEAKEKDKRKDDSHDAELHVTVWSAAFDAPGAYFLKISIEPPKGGHESTIRRTEVVSGLTATPQFQNNSFAIPFPLPKKKRWRLLGEEHRELVIAAGVVETDPPAVEAAGESVIPLVPIMERLLTGEALPMTLPLHAPIEHKSSRTAAANRGIVGTLEIEIRMVVPEALHPTMDDSVPVASSYGGSHDSVAESRIPRDIDKEIARVLREPEGVPSIRQYEDTGQSRNDESRDIAGILPPNLDSRNAQYRPPPAQVELDASSARYQSFAPELNGAGYQFPSSAPRAENRENFTGRPRPSEPVEGVKQGKAKPRAASPNFARSISNARAHRGAEPQARQQKDSGFPDSDPRNPLTARLIKELDDRNAGIQKLGRELVRLRDVNAQLEGDVRRLQAQLAESDLRTTTYMRAVDLDVLSEAELRRRYAVILQKLQTETDARKSLEAELASSQQVRMERNELERQLLEVRAAHTGQQMYLQKLQEKVQSTSKYQAVIAKQERVIAGLEEILQKSASAATAAPTAPPAADDWRFSSLPPRGPSQTNLPPSQIPLPVQPDYAALLRAERERANQLEYELLHKAPPASTQNPGYAPVAIPRAPAFSPDDFRAAPERRGGEDPASLIRAQRAEQRAAALENEASCFAGKCLTQIK
ncbi:hypothetical protein HDU87_003545 [Geranomyces variabilis]|uniref:C2 NT-type domain-containing protein n=1 Tax=Geranomyces variabilis TaxID=109894 RepID=A0AAD5TJT8_9FUNG|nr:hypothetical protein HDU87_003545 [Geranomyces variabilis]